MINKNKAKISDLIANKYLIKSVYPAESNFLDNLKVNRPIKIVYGETYDQFGMTLDSLKYYFFVSLLHQFLEESGYSVSSSVIVGDLHSIKNKQVKNKEAMLEVAQSRLELISKVISTYGLKFTPVLMSQLFQERSFKKRFDSTTKLFNYSQGLQAIAAKTVLKNRLAQEKASGFQYVLEEVSLITAYDIKVGPPREIYFDQMANLLNKQAGSNKLCGIYLQPTFPLGLNFDYFLTHPEVEEFGLTPYKAGSNKLQDHRIILGQTSLTDAGKLIQNSFFSANPNLPNPALEVYLISKLAAFLLQQSSSFSASNQDLQDADKFKSLTHRLLAKNIYQPMDLG